MREDVFEYGCDLLSNFVSLTSKSNGRMIMMKQS